MCKKMAIVSYAEINDNGELWFEGRKYAYFINTKKQIKKGDFICIEDPSGNEDKVRSLLACARVQNIVDYKGETEETAELISKCVRAPREKIFVGKADLGDYFAEADKQRKRKELQQKIEKRFKEAEKEALYRKLAETDPEMKALLSELDNLK